jgi:hypothetical protein
MVLQKQDFSTLLFGVFTPSAEFKKFIAIFERAFASSQFQGPAIHLVSYCFCRHDVLQFDFYRILTWLQIV